MSRRTLYTSLKLNAEELAWLALDVGDGDGEGFQKFIVHLRGCVEDYETGVIMLCDADIGRIFRYAAYAEGDGGYEGRFRKIFGRVLTEPFLNPQRVFSFSETV
jgi:hypothetical protein